MRKLLLLSFLLLSNSILVAMERQNKEIIIEDADGIVFGIPEDDACLLGVIEKWNIKSDDIKDDSVTKFSLQDTPAFSKDNLQLLSFIMKHEMAERCKAEKIKDIFILADALEAPKKILKKIKKRAWDILPLNEINKELPGLYECLKSIASVSRELIGSKKLYFVDKKVCYLGGIRALANDSTESINLNNNRLRFVNVNKLFKLFPNLKQLDLGHNQLEQIKLPYRLPDFFILNLSNNMLVTIPVFKVNEGCVVDLRNNPLSDQAKVIALNATKWNYMRPLKDWHRRLFCSFDRITLVVNMAIRPIAFGVGGFGASYINNLPLLNSGKQSESNEYQNVYILGGVAIGLISAWYYSINADIYDHIRYKESKIIL